MADVKGRHTEGLQAWVLGGIRGSPGSGRGAAEIGGGSAASQETPLPAVVCARLCDYLGA